MTEKDIDTQMFLNCLFKNTQIILIEIKNVLNKITAEKIKKVFKKEYKEYQNIEKEIINLGKICNYELNSIGNLRKISNCFISSIIFLNSYNDKKIVKKILEETNKIIIEIGSKMKAYNGKEVKVLVLGKRFKSILENNTLELTRYL